MYLFLSLSLSTVHLQRLHYLILSNNHFHGTIPPLNNSLLTTLDLSNNELTGNLPSELFSNTSLRQLAIVNNCLNNKLPNEICYANKSLEVLILDGLHAAIACQKPLFFNSYHVTLIPNQIPSCLFTSFEYLTTLHLSGNGYTGSLPHVKHLTPFLIDLSISHNLLTGIIPNAFLSHVWTTLDLSFNTLAGTLTESMYSFHDLHSALYLNINRLSGTIPSQLRSAKNIRLLSGNIFICDAAKQSLPQNDEYRGSYQCGSDSINDAIYAWLVVIFLVFIVISIYYYYLYKLKHDNNDDMEQLITRMSSVANDTQPFYIKRIRRLRKRLSSLLSPSNHPLFRDADIDDSNTPQSAFDKYFFFSFASAMYTYWHWYELQSKPLLALRLPIPLDYLLQLRSLWMWIIKGLGYIMLVNIIVIVPCFAAFGVYYQTYKYTYAWQISMGFLSGSEPVIIMIVLLIPSCLVIFAPMMNTIQEHTERKRKVELEEEQKLKDQRKLQGISTTSSKSLPNLDDNEGNVTRNSGNDSECGTDCDDGEEDDNNEEVHHFSWSNAISTFFYVSFNIIFVLVVNMTYVYITSPSFTSLGSQQKEQAAVFISIYKIFWNWFIFYGARKLTTATVNRISPFHNKTENDRNNVGKDEEECKTTSPIGQSTSTTSFSSSSSTTTSPILSIKQLRKLELEKLKLKKREQNIQKTRFHSMITLSILNNVVAPCVAVAAFSPDCFYYTFTTPPEVSVRYSFDYYQRNDGVTNVGHSASYSYLPAFTYSFQCSSTLMLSFADVFIYRYLIGSLLLPFIWLLIKALQEYLGRVYLKMIIKQYQRSKQPQPQSQVTIRSLHDSLQTIVFVVFRISTLVLTPMMKPLSLPPYLPASCRCNDNDIPKDILSALKALDVDVDDLGTLGYAATLVTDLAIFMTFGIIISPIAVVGYVAIIAHVIYLQLVVGRIVILSCSDIHHEVDDVVRTDNLKQDESTNDINGDDVTTISLPEADREEGDNSKPVGLYKNHMQKYLIQLSKECEGIQELVYEILPHMMWLMTCFWSFFLFDTTGDSLGYIHALWALFVTSCGLPLVVYLLTKWWIARKSQKINDGKLNVSKMDGENSVDVELTTFSSNVSDQTHNPMR